jgi:hypothetical protein
MQHAICNTPYAPYLASEDKSAGRAATASGFKHLVDTSARGKTIDEEEEEEEEEEEGQRSWLSEQWEEFNYAVLGCGGRCCGTPSHALRLGVCNSEARCRQLGAV